MCWRLPIRPACRALSVCSRSARTVNRPRFGLPSVARTAFRSYSVDADGQRPGGPLEGEKTTSSSRTEPRDVDSSGGAASLHGEGAGTEAVVSEPAGEMVEESPMEVVDDATLEQMLYGGQTATLQGKEGLTAAQEERLYSEGTIRPAAETETLQATREVDEAEATWAVSEMEGRSSVGHKFGLPKKPYPEGFQLKERYHPVLGQITRLMMRHGKLGVAQRNMTMVMNFLRTAPAPIYSPKFPLLPGTPPASHLPLNPVLYITIAIDSVAPLLRVRNIAGAGGGGRALELPVPMAVRQRRRMAFQWILEAVKKKPSKGSGRREFPHRVAEEIIAVVEGRSSVWEKRRQVHKLATAARANVGSRRLKVKKKMS